MKKNENYDLLTNVIICLGDAYDKEASGILRMLEVLLSDKRNASEKRMNFAGRFWNPNGNGFRK